LPSPGCRQGRATRRREPTKAQGAKASDEWIVRGQAAGAASGIGDDGRRRGERRPGAGRRRLGRLHARARHPPAPIRGALPAGRERGGPRASQSQPEPETASARNRQPAAGHQVLAAQAAQLQWSPARSRLSSARGRLFVVPPASKPAGWATSQVVVAGASGPAGRLSLAPREGVHEHGGDQHAAPHALQRVGPTRTA
jgi:hypothetical protein